MRTKILLLGIALNYIFFSNTHASDNISPTEINFLIERKLNPSPSLDKEESLWKERKKYFRENLEDLKKVTNIFEFVPEVQEDWSHLFLNIGNFQINGIFPTHPNYPDISLEFPSKEDGLLGLHLIHKYRKTILTINENFMVMFRQEKFTRGHLESIRASAVHALHFSRVVDDFIAALYVKAALDVEEEIDLDSLIEKNTIWNPDSLKRISAEGLNNKRRAMLGIAHSRDNDRMHPYNFLGYCNYELEFLSNNIIYSINSILNNKDNRVEEYLNRPIHSNLPPTLSSLVDITDMNGAFEKVYSTQEEKDNLIQPFLFKEEIKKDTSEVKEPITQKYTLNTEENITQLKDSQNNSNNTLGMQEINNDSDFQPEEVNGELMQLNSLLEEYGTIKGMNTNEFLNFGNALSKLGYFDKFKANKKALQIKVTPSDDFPQGAKGTFEMNHKKSNRRGKGDGITLTTAKNFKSILEALRSAIISKSLN